MLRYLSVGRQRARLIAGCVSLAGCVATERSLPIAPPPSNMVLSATVPEYSAAVPEMAIDPRDPRRVHMMLSDTEGGIGGSSTISDAGATGGSEDDGGCGCKTMIRASSLNGVTSAPSTKSQRSPP